MKTTLSTFGNGWTNIPSAIMADGGFKSGKGFTVLKVSKKSIDLVRSRKKDSDYFVHCDGRAKLPIGTFFPVHSNMTIKTKTIDNGMRITIV